MEIEEVDLVVDGRRLKALLSKCCRTDVPLLVALHGVGYDARYFDAPWSSVHRMVTESGMSMLSITRPGYPADDDSARVQPCLADTARIVSGAIGVALAELVDSAGAVVLGHSVGGAVTIHLAAQLAGDAPEWPLLGIAVSGIGDRPSAVAKKQFVGAPRDMVMSVSARVCRAAFYGGPESLPPGAEASLADLLVPYPSADAVEVNSTWADDFPNLAGRVRVPVYLALVDGDPLWEVSQRRLDEMASSFTASPRVATRLWAGAGHNLEHHRAGSGYIADVLEFTRDSLQKERR